MKNTRDVGNRLAPFFKAHGFTRKSNMFYKIQNNIAFCAGLERPGGLYSLCYILPLYMPTDVRHIMFGSRLERFKRFPVESVDFIWDEPSKIEEFAEKTIECCEKYFFPLYDSISTPESLMDFLNKGYKYAHSFFTNLDLWRFYELRIYTNFILSRYDAMLMDIPLACDAANLWPISKEAKDYCKKSLSELADLRFAPEEEKQEFIKNTIEHSLIACRFKKKNEC